MTESKESENRENQEIFERLNQIEKENQELRKELRKLRTRRKNQDNENKSQEKISRRDFLKKIGLGAAGLGAASMIPSASADFQKLTTQNWAESNFNQYTDADAVQAGKNAGFTDMGEWTTNGDRDLKVHGQRALVGYNNGELIIGYENDFTQTNIQSTPVKINGNNVATQNYVDNTNSTENEMVFGAHPSYLDQSTLDNLTTQSNLMSNIANRGDALNQIRFSEKAMKAISNSSTAMNAISNSEQARNLFTKTNTAREAIVNVNMASSKFIAGIAGYNPNNYSSLGSIAETIKDDNNAMEAISQNNTAMEAISQNNTAMDEFLKNYQSASALHSYNVAISNIWDGGNPSGNSIQFTHTESTSQYAIGTGGSSTFNLVRDIDVSGISTLNIDWVVDDGYGSNQGDGTAYVVVNGNEEYNTTYNNGGTINVDISGYSGRVSLGVKLYCEINNCSGCRHDLEVRIRNFWLS